MKIDSFSGEYRFLSNFWYSKIIINGKEYKTVEHFFQASKAKYLEEHEIIRNSNKPSDAKRLGREIDMREDWEQIKDSVMLQGVKEKFFQNTDLAQKLIDTKDAELIEGNTWGDTYWGVCKGKGKNHLGKILMYVRNLLFNKVN